MGAQRRARPAGKVRPGHPPLRRCHRPLAWARRRRARSPRNASYWIEASLDPAQADDLGQGDDHLAQHLERLHLRAALPPVLQRLEEQPLDLAARGAGHAAPQRCRSRGSHREDWGWTQVTSLRLVGVGGAPPIDLTRSCATTPRRRQRRRPHGDRRAAAARRWRRARRSTSPSTGPPRSRAPSRAPAPSATTSSSRSGSRRSACSRTTAGTATSSTRAPSSSPTTASTTST